MNNQQLLGTEPIGKLLLKFCIPAVIGMLVNALYNLVDRIFIGNIPNVGSLAITGVGITMPISTVVLAFGMLIGIGTATNMSIKMGERKSKEAANIVGNAFTLLIIASLALTAVGIIFLDPILYSFGATDQTIGFAKEYITIIIWGTIVCMFSFSLTHMTRADGNPKLSALVMVVGCLINIVLDPIFIFVFNWGIQGAAIATILSQAVTAIWLIYYFTKGKSTLKLQKKFMKLKPAIIKTIFAIGMAPFAMQIAASVVQVVANQTLMKYGGDTAIGAMTIINSISLFFLMPTFGINQGSQPIIGYNYGAKQHDRSKKTLLYAMSITTIFLSVVFFLIQFFPSMFVRLFNDDPALMSVSVEGLRIFLFGFPLLGVSVVGPNYFQSIGKAKISLVLSLLRQVILFIPLLLILPHFFGLRGIWFVQPICDTITAVLTAYFLRKEMKRLDGEQQLEIAA